jgi:hypothetical protein
LLQPQHVLLALRQQAPAAAAAAAAKQTHEKSAEFVCVTEEVAIESAVDEF